MTRMFEICHVSPISGICSWGESLVVTVGYDNRVIWWDHVTRRGADVRHHDHLVNDCAFSSDGTLLATASADHTARIWDNRDRKLIRVLTDHVDDVDRVVFDPNNRFLATTSHDTTVCIYSTDDWTKVAQVQGHEDTVYGFVWLQDSGSFVTTSNDGSVRFWADFGRKEVVAVRLDCGDIDAIESVKGTIVVGNDLGELIHLSEEGSVLERVQAHASGIKKVKASPSGDHLITVGYDGQLKKWQNACGQSLVQVSSIEAPREAWLRSICWTSESEVGVGSFGPSYLVLDTRTQMWSGTEAGTTPGINCSANLAGTCSSLTAGDAGMIRLGKDTIGEVGRPITSLVTSPGDVVVGCLDGTIYRGQETIDGWAFFESVALSSAINCLSFSPDDTQPTVIAGTYNGEVALLRFDDDQLRCESLVKLGKAAVKDVLHGGDTLFVLFSNGVGGSIPMPLGSADPSFAVGHSQIANAAARLTDGRFISVGRDRMMVFWSDGAILEKISTPFSHSTKAIATDDRDEMAVVGSYDGQVGCFSIKSRSWDMFKPTFKAISSISHIPSADDFLICSFSGEVFRLSEL